MELNIQEMRKELAIYISNEYEMTTERELNRNDADGILENVLEDISERVNEYIRVTEG